MNYNRFLDLKDRVKELEGHRVRLGQNVNNVHSDLWAMTVRLDDEFQALLRHLELEVVERKTLADGEPRHAIVQRKVLP